MQRRLDNSTKASQRYAVNLLSAVFLFAALVATPFASAQNDKRGESLRTVHGNVVDKDDSPVTGSVVYLLNTKTQSVQTYISEDGGLYRFSGLDPNVDYEIHAEHNDLTSPVRTVSSFNSQRDIDITLKLSHNKKK